MDPSVVRACDWILANDPQTSPVPSGWIDLQAGYWRFTMSTSFPVGTVLRIDGQYPNSRLFSFAVEQGLSAVVSSLTDFEIAPSAGSATPYSGPTTYDPSVAPGGKYTAYLVFGPKPAQPAPNTMYVDTSTFPTNDTDVVVIMRIYNAPPGQATAAAGNVPLPTLTVETAQGDVPLSSYKPGTPACKALNAAEGAFSTALTEKISAAQSTPKAPNPIPAMPVPAAPKFRLYRSVKQDQGLDLTLNPDAQYGTWYISQTKADLVYIRALAPTYVTQPGVGQQPHSTDSDAQVRHWAVCSNGSSLLNSRTFQCVEDYTATIGSDGYFNIIISIPGKKPALTLLAQGYDWLTYGETNIDVPIYRQLRPSPDYAQAMANVADGDAASQDRIARVMGSYMPQITYCGGSVFAQHAQAGESRAQVFAACQAGQ
ncbi:MAG: hypothetical protein P4L83_06435 [Nevskia sp.]|nr:hypothetical protein [Nevskia sp.]